jgi:uncharacterized membrane protein
MKTIILSFALMVFLIPIAFGNEGLMLKTAHFTNEPVNPGDEGTLIIKLDNHFSHKLKDLHISVLNDDLGIYYKSGRIEIGNSDEETIYITFQVPDSAAPGDFDLRISIENDLVHKFEYRTITII